MATPHYLGLDASKAAEIATGLNHLLANFQLHYQNLRGFHWNLRGDDFFELHVKFEELYNDAILRIDEVAERIVTLGETPLHTYADYSSVAETPAHKNVTDGKTALKLVLESFGVLLKHERKLLDLAAAANDEGTNALMSDYIAAHEKTGWMLAAYLG